MHSWTLPSSAHEQKMGGSIFLLVTEESVILAICKQTNSVDKYNSKRLCVAEPVAAVLYQFCVSDTRTDKQHCRLGWS